jgi:hypothetical protein
VHSGSHVGSRRSTCIKPKILKTVKTIKNQFSAIVGVAFVLGLACVGTRGADSPLAQKPKIERPERPAKPEKAVNAAELKEIIKSFQDQKKEFLRQQKEQQRDERAKVREELTSATPTVGAVRRELKDSINDAKRQAKEQGRKLLEEQKEAAKEERKRD